MQGGVPDVLTMYVLTCFINFDLSFSWRALYIKKIIILHDIYLVSIAYIHLRNFHSVSCPFIFLGNIAWDLFVDDSLVFSLIAKLEGMSLLGGGRKQHGCHDNNGDLAGSPLTLLILRPRPHRVSITFPPWQPWANLGQRNRERLQEQSTLPLETQDSSMVSRVMEIRSLENWEHGQSKHTPESCQGTQLSSQAFLKQQAGCFQRVLPSAWTLLLKCALSDSSNNVI